MTRSTVLRFAATVGGGLLVGMFLGYAAFSLSVLFKAGMVLYTLFGVDSTQCDPLLPPDAVVRLTGGIGLLAGVALFRRSMEQHRAVSGEELMTKAVGYSVMGLLLGFVLFTAIAAALGLPRGDGFSCELRHPLSFSFLGAVSGACVGTGVALRRLTGPAAPSLPPSRAADPGRRRQRPRSHSGSRQVRPKG